MTTTRYWLSSPSTKVWILVLILCSALAVMTTLYLIKLKPEAKALDLAIAEAVLKAGSDHCKLIKSRNFIARSSGLEAQAGCSRK